MLRLAGILLVLPMRPGFVLSDLIVAARCRVETMAADAHMRGGMNAGSRQDSSPSMNCFVGLWHSVTIRKWALPGHSLAANQSLLFGYRVF